MNASPTPTPTSSTASTTPPFAPTREVRFAVVMYGGVSLAIYINGVAQELLRLVRATAPAAPAAKEPTSPLLTELTPLDRVYRRLGQFLGSPYESGGQPSQVKAETDPICTRFVVDILSGTSAGGINAIFLAKALANNQRLDDLKRLWLEEGDLAKLLNDRKSIEDLRLKLQVPPESLLNSRRMYRKLLEAFDGMEQGGRSADDCRSCCVEELDLWVTATDLRGLTLPLRLADRLVYERRYRNVFHLVYGTREATDDARNDFGADMNPFLAFAARCTSSFPFAFEPMRLKDIEEVLATVPAYQGQSRFLAGDTRWQGYFKDYLRDDPQTEKPPGLDYVERPFGDGGYLDNKPFSYATDAILRRHAELPVDRKMIYVEPVPEHPELQRDPLGKPDALANAAAALLTLPRYETIREDIERVTDRNRLIDRINRVTVDLENDMRAAPRFDRSGSRSYPEWSAMDLRGMIQRKGVAYGVYHRLKVAAVVDDLAELFTRLAGFDENADQFLAVRYLVRAWRDRNYVENKPARASHDTRATQNQMLMEFDLDYRFRRLNFVRRKVDELHRLDERSQRVLHAAGVGYWPGPDEERAFREALRKAKKNMSHIVVSLRGTGRRLRAPSADNPLRAEMNRLDLSLRDLKGLLEQPTDELRTQWAGKLLDSRGAAFQAVAAKLKDELSRAFIRASDHARAALESTERPGASMTPDLAVRRCLWHFYQHFEDYDMVIVPIHQGTDLGETDTVEIIRISPEDATSLIDESQPGRRKLAGTVLFNFGAFLNRVWRENDMLWGRLDAAERLITTLLPATVTADERRALLEEAQRAIIAEELRPQDRDQLCRLLGNALSRLEPGDANEARLLQMVRQEYGQTLNPKLEAVLRACLDERQLLEYFRSSYEVDRRFPPESSVRNLARSTRITGELLEGIADRHHVRSRYIPWLARAGAFLCGLIELSVPGRIPNLFLRHWLKVLYLFELFLLGGGFLLGALGLGVPQVQKFGLVALGLTALVHLLCLGLGALMRGRRAKPTVRGAGPPSDRVDNTGTRQ